MRRCLLLAESYIVPCCVCTDPVRADGCDPIAGREPVCCQLRYSPWPQVHLTSDRTSHDTVKFTLRAAKTSVAASIFACSCLSTAGHSADTIWYAGYPLPNTQYPRAADHEPLLATQYLIPLVPPVSYIPPSHLPHAFVRSQAIDL